MISINDHPIHFSIYPNPSSDVIKISSSELIEEVSVFDYSGKLVLIQRVEGKNFILNTQNLNSGSYIAKIKTETRELKNTIIIE